MSDRYDTHPSESEILPNKLNLTEQDAINSEEAIGFLLAEQTAIDVLGPDTVFSLRYLYDLHRASLEHLYDFAGRLRTVDMSKGGFMFAPAHVLSQTMGTFDHEYLLTLTTRELDNDISLLEHLASMHAELLYIHPFREGNGRIVRLFTKLIFLARTGEELNFGLITQGNNFDRYVAAVQQAVSKEYDAMRELFRELRA